MDKTVAICLALLACLLPAARALSYPLCDNGGQTWVTDRPSRNPLYPGADLYFFCDSGLNFFGEAVDPCLNDGSICTLAVTTAICKFLGYDAADGAATAARAQPGEAVRSLTGEYCLREGTYAKALPDNLAAMPGQPCMKVDSIACVRSNQRMADSLEPIVMEAVTAPRASASPATATLSTTSPETSVNPAGAAPSSAAPEVTAASGPTGAGPGSGGRKLKL